MCSGPRMFPECSPNVPRMYPGNNGCRRECGRASPASLAAWCPPGLLPRTVHTIIGDRLFASVKLLRHLSNLGLHYIGTDVV
eukprot:600352-Pyramimonas_sp.AAC.1